MNINHRYGEGSPMVAQLYSSVTSRLHAIRLEDIKNRSLSSSKLRPALCGTKCEVNTFELGKRKFLKEFDEDNELACKHCLRRIREEAVA